MLAACRAAYDRWSDRADNDLPTYLDAALTALASGFDPVPLRAAPVPGPLPVAAAVPVRRDAGPGGVGGAAPGVGVFAGDYDDVAGVPLATCTLAGGRVHGSSDWALM